MGTEYYILKPRTKEMFHLGKDLWYNLEGISQREPNFPEWQEYEDTACDIIRARCYVSDDNMEYIMSLAYEIFEFCDCEEVRLANDCENDISWLDEYKETMSISDICRKVYGGD